MSETTRRGLLSTGAAVLAASTSIATGRAAMANSISAGRGASDESASGPPGGGKGEGHFFKNPSFEFTFQIALGAAYYQGTDTGRLLYLARQIPNGDSEAAYRTLTAAGDDVMAVADASASAGHRESARQAYGWAQNYYNSAGYFVDGSNDPSRAEGTYDLFDSAWLKGVAQMASPPAQVAIPYEGVALRGFYFRGNGRGAKRPLLILNNGSDGSLLAIMTMGGFGALARGYDVLIFDGPGQGYALWKQGLYFRPDWEKVITPVVDFAVTLDGIDERRIALLGISQGGYWVPRAVAFEKRIAAAVADPGVVDVSASWLQHFPPQMVDLLQSGRKQEFDDLMEKGLPAAGKAALGFRMRPYGMTSCFDVFTTVQRYQLGDLVGRITCPMLITAPENEAFWPGQSAELHDGLTGPKRLVPFTVSEGGDLHCEPGALGLRDLRIFDWLDETLA